MIGESTKQPLDARVFVEFGASERDTVILTTEVEGRTTNRIVLSFAAVSKLQAFLAQLQVTPVQEIGESAKKLRG